MHGERRIVTSPLAATLERVSAPKDGKFPLSARVGVPDESGWTLAADLAGGGNLLAEAISRLGREYGTDNVAYVGTSLLRGCLWRILTPAVAAFLTERRLPDLRAANVALRFDESGFATGLAFVGARFAALPDDPDAGHPDAMVLPSEDALLGELRVAIVEGQLSALIPALRGLRVRRGTRTLWRVAVDVCAEAFMSVGQDLGRESEALGCAGRLLGGPPPLCGPTNYFALEHGGESMITRVRNSCCLYYRVGDGPCFTCPRVSNEERLRRLEEAASSRRSGE
jgi:hypothetical protein